MINIQSFLIEQYKSEKNKNKNYAIIKYNKDDKIIEDVVYFSHYNFDGDWYLEAPCVIHKIDFTESIDDFCHKYVSETIELEDGCNPEDYIEKYIKPLIRNKTYYEIDCPQTGPFLPKEVEKITLITESEALDYILKTKC